MFNNLCDINALLLEAKLHFVSRDTNPNPVSTVYKLFPLTFDTKIQDLWLCPFTRNRKEQKETKECKEFGVKVVGFPLINILSSACTDNQ